jgi:hypothetical protein
VENNVDPTHALILHQNNVGMRAKPLNSTRGFIDDQPSWGFHPVPYGIMKQRHVLNGETDEHPYIFPNILGQSTARWMVPVDDTHTWLVTVGVPPNHDPSEAGLEPEVTYSKPYKDPPDLRYPFARYEHRTIMQQDILVWETQRTIADRTV